MKDGGETVDLTYVTPPTAPATMQLLGELLHRVYAELSGTVLLSISPPDDLIALADWYLGEFARQGASEPPVAWTGPLRLVLSSRREVS